MRCVSVLDRVSGLGSFSGYGSVSVVDSACGFCVFGQILGVSLFLGVSFILVNRVVCVAASRCVSGFENRVSGIVSVVALEVGRVARLSRAVVLFM